MLVRSILPPLSIPSRCRIGIQDADIGFYTNGFHRITALVPNIAGGRRADLQIYSHGPRALL